MEIFYRMVGGRRRIVVALSFFALPSIAGLVRTFETGLSVGDQQWDHVLKHEQRFIQALTAGTAAEGDDAGGF